MFSQVCYWNRFYLKAYIWIPVLLLTEIRYEPASDCSLQTMLVCPNYTVKVKKVTSLCLIKHHAMKTYGGVKNSFTILTYELDRIE
jgi:uncharacterized protein (DUF362 family)